MCHVNWLVCLGSGFLLFQHLKLKMDGVREKTEEDTERSKEIEGGERGERYETERGRRGEKKREKEEGKE